MFDIALKYVRLQHISWLVYAGRFKSCHTEM